MTTLDNDPHRHLCQRLWSQDDLLRQFEADFLRVQELTKLWLGQFRSFRDRDSRARIAKARSEATRQARVHERRQLLKNRRGFEAQLERVERCLAALQTCRRRLAKARLDPLSLPLSVLCPQEPDPEGRSLRAQ